MNQWGSLLRRLDGGETGPRLTSGHPIAGHATAGHLQKSVGPNVKLIISVSLNHRLGSQEDSQSKKKKGWGERELKKTVKKQNKIKPHKAMFFFNMVEDEKSHISPT